MGRQPLLSARHREARIPVPARWRLERPSDRAARLGDDVDCAGDGAAHRAGWVRRRVERDERAERPAIRRHRSRRPVPDRLARTRHDCRHHRRRQHGSTDGAGQGSGQGRSAPSFQRAGKRAVARRDCRGRQTARGESGAGSAGNCGRDLGPGLSVSDQPFADRLARADFREGRFRDSRTRVLRRSAADSDRAGRYLSHRSTRPVWPAGRCHRHVALGDRVPARRELHCQHQSLLVRDQVPARSHDRGQRRRGVGTDSQRQAGRHAALQALGGAVTSATGRELGARSRCETPTTPERHELETVRPPSVPRIRQVGAGRSNHERLAEAACSSQNPVHSSSNLSAPR